MSRHVMWVVGLGSAHGDDRAGWAVVERLAPLASQMVSVRAARSPADLLMWLEAALPPPERLVICDAARGGGPPGRVRRWTWPAAKWDRRPAGGSHEFGLADALALADQLHLLPREVVIWTIEARAAHAGEEMSQDVVSAVNRLADVICGTWSDAPDRVERNR